MTGLILRAFAKINLNLKVLGRRPDGYHELRTVLQSITLHDDLELLVGGVGLRLLVDDPHLPSGPENLVWRAVERLAPPLTPAHGLSIRLTKRIPAGAGLGGGSSDAAAALFGVNHLYCLGLSDEEMQSHAAALGCDLPYVLVGGTALLSGRGTEVLPLPDLPRSHLVVVHPGQPLSTRAVYAQLQEPLTLAPEPVSISSFGRLPVDLESWVRSGNDLEPHATRLCPAVGHVQAALSAAGATTVAMSGSGSAVFGLFADGEAARCAAGIMQQAGFKAIPCTTQDRETFTRERIKR